MLYSSGIDHWLQYGLGLVLVGLNGGSCPCQCLRAFDCIFFWPVDEWISNILMQPARKLHCTEIIHVVVSSHSKRSPIVAVINYIGILTRCWHDLPLGNNTKSFSYSIFQIKHFVNLLRIGVRLIVYSSSVIPGTPSRLWNFPSFQNFLNTDICYWDSSLADFPKALLCIPALDVKMLHFNR